MEITLNHIDKQCAERADDGLCPVLEYLGKASLPVSIKLKKFEGCHVPSRFMYER